MNESDKIELEIRIAELEQKLNTTNEALGTLIVFLQRELGTQNATDLLRQLDGKPFEGDL